MTKRTSIVTTLLASTVLAGLVAGASAQELVTADRIGLADAPKSHDLPHQPADFTHTSPTPSQAEGFKKLFTQFAEKHPDWQINIEYFTPDIGGEHARMLEQARAGRAPRLRHGRLLPAGALHPAGRAGAGRRSTSRKEEVDDLFPFIKAGITGPDGKLYAWWWNTDLRLLYRNKDFVPNAPQDWAELKAAALDAAGEGQGRRALQRRPLGRHHLRLAGAVLGAGRQAGRRHRQADLRRRRRPRRRC